MVRTELSCAGVRPTFLAAAAAVLFASAAPAQSLRHGVLAADLVVVATVDGVQPIGQNLILHKLTPSQTLRGEAPARLTVVQDKRVSDGAFPVLGAPRLCCLVATPDVELPARHGPYYRMTGFTGDHAVVPTDPATPCAALDLARVVLESETGLAPRSACVRLMNIGMRGGDPACAEAIDIIRARDAVRRTVDPIQKSALLARAIAETDDVALKCSLASLCAEIRMPDVIESLCLAIEHSDSDDFARTVGRLARFVHGEAATEVLKPYVARARAKKPRARLLLAVGATETRSALAALLQHRKLHGRSDAVDAALRAHGAKGAIEAVGSRK